METHTPDKPRWARYVSAGYHTLDLVGLFLIGISLILHGLWGRGIGSLVNHIIVFLIFGVTMDMVSVIGEGLYAAVWGITDPDRNKKLVLAAVAVGPLVLILVAASLLLGFTVGSR